MSNFSTFFPAGGGAPLGSLGYLEPSQSQTYVAGQEVFEADSGSFLQSGSILLQGGGGKEDASNYDASLLSEGIGTLNSNAWSYGDRNDRTGAFWDGTHIVQVSYENSTGYLILTALNESDFSLAYTGNVGPTLWPAAAGIVDGDYLIYARSWLSSVPIPSTNPEVKRVLKTDLTSYTSYATATSVNSNGTIVDWDMPSGYRSYPLFTACNQGLSNEKHYFANNNGSSGTAYCTIGQCTYNDAAGTNTSPWTLTGSTIVLPVTTGTRIVSLAGDLNTLWVQTSTNIMYKYNSTTLALEATISIPSNLQTTWVNNYSRNGVFVIPASESSTGVARFFMNTEAQSSSVAPIFKEVFLGQLIQAPGLYSLTTYDGTNITGSSGNVNGWMKIK
jgi:hypothetical protein